LVRLDAPDGVSTDGALIPGSNTKYPASLCLFGASGGYHPHRQLRKDLSNRNASFWRGGWRS